MSQPSWIGYNLGGRYQIDELIGQGGMSAVYKATDPNLRRTVAVKLIHGHLSSNPEFVRRFEEEAAAVAQLSHPNIIQVFDFNHEGDTYYMVLEFLPGESLQERLKRNSESGRQMDSDEAMEIMATVCDAVEFAHKRDMIHRDIKPANVMLTAQGQPVLMDFGVVKMVGSKQHTATGAVIGTALYMSPEQVRGEHPDKRADVYSLGVTLFEMLSGSPPYEADSAMTTMMMHLNDPVPDILALNPSTPRGLKNIIETALAKAPEDRFQSVGEMANALRRVLAGEDVPVDAASTLLETSQPVGPEGTLLETPPEPQMSGEGTLLESTAPQPQVQSGGAATTPARATEAVGGQSSAPRAPAKKQGGLPMGLILGGGGALAVLAIIVVVVVFVIGGGGSGGGTEPAEEPVEEPVVVAAEPTDAPAPTEVPVVEETGPTAVPEPIYTPTPDVPPGIPYVRINGITEEGGVYSVDFEAFEYQPALPGMHVHFFFDTVPPETAGVPGAGPWKIYGAPSPFRDYTVAERPAGATQMCSLVANPDHSVQPNSGTCYPLP